ncbi:DUF4115 domain-containing protein [Simiduia litorea]|uniref:helix-turn-helix domain-containing protein n=1 Tax=Simiduia litorea TaxID=1435348 RepID=UPI0036F3AFED
MTEEDEKVEVASADTDAVLTPGAMLEQARKAKGLDVRAAADQLRMSRVKLIALEADAFEEFQGETFIRGYIKAYCRILDLDEAQAIARYENYVAATAEVSLLVAPREAKSLGLGLYDKPSIKPVFIGVAVVLALVALVAFFIYPSLDAEPDVAAVAPVAATSDVNADAAPTVEQDDVVDLQDDRVGETVGQPVEGLPPAVDSREAVKPVITEAVTSAPVDVAPVFDTLTIVFTEECWLEVSDAKGDVLATELKDAGNEVVLQGKAPFNVMLGNARAATVFLNGAKVDSNPRNSNRALRFTVDQP